MHNPLERQQELERWLLEEGLVTPVDLQEVRAWQLEKGTELSTTLLEHGVVEEDQLVDLLGRRHNLPKAPRRLHRQSVPARALSSIPQDLCWQYHVFPFAVDVVAGRLQVAMADPADPEAHELLDSIGGLEVEMFVVGPRALEKAIRKHYMDAWVDDSRGGARFFGYEEMTNPGLSPWGTMPAATPAAPPAPKRTKNDVRPVAGGQGAAEEAGSNEHALRPTEVNPTVPGPSREVVAVAERPAIERGSKDQKARTEAVKDAALRATAAAAAAVQAGAARVAAARVAAAETGSPQGDVEVLARVAVRAPVGGGPNPGQELPDPEDGAPPNPFEGAPTRADSALAQPRLVTGQPTDDAPGSDAVSVDIVSVPSVTSAPASLGRLRPTVSRAELNQRLERVERALASLCATLAGDADPPLDADLRRILSYLAAEDK